MVIYFFLSKIKFVIKWQTVNMCCCTVFERCKSQTTNCYFAINNVRKITTIVSMLVEKHNILAGDRFQTMWCVAENLGRLSGRDVLRGTVQNPETERRSASLGTLRPLATRVRRRLFHRNPVLVPIPSFIVHVHFDVYHDRPQHKHTASFVKQLFYDCKDTRQRFDGPTVVTSWNFSGTTTHNII